MAELLLVSNPKKRRKLTAKQRAAGFGGKRAKRKSRRTGGRKHRKVRAAGRRTKRARRPWPSGHRAMGGYIHGRKRIRRWKLNPHHRRRRHRHHYRRRRHSNPMTIRGVTGAFMPTLRAGGWGALGALGNDAGYGLIVGLLNSNMPTVGSYLSNPYVGFLAKAFNAVLVGTLGGRFLRGRGQQLAVGAMTVVTHDFLKSMLVQMAPTIFGPGGSVPLGSYVSGYGSYVSGFGGAAPIVGTATVPQAYLPFSGGTGMADTAGGGQWVDDTVGLDPWGGNQPDRIGY